MLTGRYWTLVLRNPQTKAHEDFFLVAPLSSDEGSPPLMLAPLCAECGLKATIYAARAWGLDRRMGTSVSGEGVAVLSKGSSEKISLDLRPSRLEPQNGQCRLQHLVFRQARDLNFGFAHHVATSGDCIVQSL